MQVYFLWAASVMSIVTFTMSGAYAFVALNPDRPELVIFLTVVTAALSFLSAAVALKGNINPFRFPSTSLFATVSVLGLVGILIK